MVKDESNIKTYIVEKSVDGSRFEKLFAVDCKMLGNYSFTDLQPNNGTNYYRINGITNNDNSIISSVVKIIIKESTKVQEIVLSPNPTTNGKFTTSFTSETAQPMVLKVIETSTGKIVKTQFISAAKGTNQVAVSLNNEQASGLYIVSLEADNIKYNNAKLIVSKK